MAENKKAVKIDLYYTAKRKKDYITALAVSFFIMILIFELLLVAWLPFYVRSMRVWAKDSAREGMIELYDNLRANLSSIAKRHSGHEAKQITLAYESLNQIANYLRLYTSKMTKSQIDECQKSLDDFNALYHKMRLGKIAPESARIEPYKFMLSQAVANGIPLPAEKIEEPEKTPEETKKDSKNPAGKTKDEKRKTK